MKNHLSAALMHGDTSCDGNISGFSSIKVEKGIACKDVVPVFGREFSEENQCVNLPKENHIAQKYLSRSHVFYRIYTLKIIGFLNILGNMSSKQS